MEFNQWIQSTHAGAVVAMIIEAAIEDPSQADAAMWCLRTNDGRVARDRAYAVLRLPKRIRDNAEQN